MDCRVVAASVCDMVYRIKTRSTRDLTLDLWPVVVCTQVVQSLSIIAACVLYLKPFLETLESGFTRADDMRRRGDSQDGSYKLSSLSSSKSKGANAANPVSKASGIQASAATARVEHDPDRASQHSQSNLIRQDRTWAVAYTSQPRTSPSDALS